MEINPNPNLPEGLPVTHLNQTFETALTDLERTASGHIKFITNGHGDNFHLEIDKGFSRDFVIVQPSDNCLNPLMVTKPQLGQINGCSAKTSGVIDWEFGPLEFSTVFYAQSFRNLGPSVLEDQNQGLNPAYVRYGFEVSIPL